MKTPLSRFRKKGFTLVETALAMGIVAFALIPIIGLIPVGLDSLREAISSTVESQIVQSISGEILLTKYDKVVTTYSQPVVTYYTEEGTLLPSDSGKLYTVTVDLKDVSAPAAPAVSNPVMSSCLRIQIGRINSPSKPHLYTLVIPKG